MKNYKATDTERDNAVYATCILTTIMVFTFWLLNMVVG